MRNLYNSVIARYGDVLTERLEIPVKHIPLFTTDLDEAILRCTVGYTIRNFDWQYEHFIPYNPYDKRGIVAQIKEIENDR